MKAFFRSATAGLLLVTGLAFIFLAVTATAATGGLLRTLAA